MEFLMKICLLFLCGLISHFVNMIFQKRNQQCYMLGYECFKAADDRKLDTDACVKVVLRNKNLGLDQYRFLLKTIVSSGLGEETYGPRNVIDGREEFPSENDAHAEMDEIMFSTLDTLFEKTENRSFPDGNRHTHRRCLVVFTSTVVNFPDYKQQLFKTYKNQFAIVVSTESIARHWYCGKEKSMMLSNCLFRNGGCSILLTNKRNLRDRCLLKLKCTVRTNIGYDDEAYGCCIQVEDPQGYQGNLKLLLPKILPVWELLRYAISTLRKKSTKGQNLSFNLNLKSGVDHFCLHPGGRAVIDGLGKSLGLSEYDLEPTRMALYRFGNTSAGGLWYVLSYMEAKKRLKKGDKVFMVSLGAGFMCNNCVWEVMKDGLEDTRVWEDCIDEYPRKNLVNPFTEKYSWINDECLNFVRLDD
ncbi:hypothetical protein GOBAR_AA12234 [Gossypium barbadense]|uniref:3-ketoacyl-CoA synthase n=1 Tax=Gossypium barbadense TaxID=3634 RepID=A0A2P5XYI9_GOSBA|nr:hypothetical protein GOBAR_AA12234 [Gossypium barbadense]